MFLGAPPVSYFAQVLPGSEEELKCKARMEEEQRQKELRRRQQLELQELCQLFGAIEASTIETVYDSCDYNRTQTLKKLLEMSEGAGEEAQGEIASVLASEVDRIDSMITHKKTLVDSSIRCPISGKPMVDPVFAADGWVPPTPFFINASIIAAPTRHLYRTIIAHTPLPPGPQNSPSLPPSFPPSLPLPPPIPFFSDACAWPILLGTFAWAGRITYHNLV